MHFGLPEQARELRDGVRAVLKTACPPAVVRQAWPGGDGAAVAALWRTLGELGLIGLLVPEPAGLGLDDLVAVAALQATGYAAVPGPIVETLYVAAPLLAAAGALPEGVLTGTEHIAVQHGQLVAHAQSSSYILQLENGTARLLRSQDAKVEPVVTVDGSRRAARVHGSGEILDLPESTVQMAERRGAVGTAATLIGLSRRMLDLTVAYVKGRQQFGVPVGSFQAVKHPLANALVATEFAEPAVLRAAQSLIDSDPDAALHVAMAKALASDAARQVAGATLQAHGAMGYTVEYDLHLFAKRAWALASDWGTAGEHRAAVAGALFERNLP
ncbi:MAG: acyl-CoA dehydrogenase family protein [Mycobacteriales bacterium]